MGEISEGNQDFLTGVECVIQGERETNKQASITGHQRLNIKFLSFSVHARNVCT